MTGLVEDAKATSDQQTKNNDAAEEENVSIRAFNSNAKSDHDAEVERLTREALTTAESEYEQNKATEMNRAKTEANSIAKKNQAIAQAAENERVAKLNDAKRADYESRKAEFYKNGDGGTIKKLLKSDSPEARGQLRGRFLGRSKGKLAGEITRSNAEAWLKRNVDSKKGIEQIYEGLLRKDWIRFDTKTKLTFKGSTEVADEGMINGKEVPGDGIKKKVAGEVFEFVQTGNKGREALIDLYQILLKNDKAKDVEPPLTPEEVMKLKAMAEFDEGPPDEVFPEQIPLVNVAPKPRFVPIVAPKPILVPKLIVKPLVNPKIAAPVMKANLNMNVNANPKIAPPKTNVVAVKLAPSLLPNLQFKGAKSMSEAQKQEMTARIWETALEDAGGDVRKALEERFKLSEEKIEQIFAAQAKLDAAQQSQ